MLAATGCLILAACGGGSPAAKPTSSKPAVSATAAAEPTSGPAAVAAITANWKTVFNGKAPIPRRLALVQNGEQVAAFVEAQAKTSFGQAATGSTATVSSVAITSAGNRRPRYRLGFAVMAWPALFLDVKEALVDEFVDAEGA